MKHKLSRLTNGHFCRAIILLTKKIQNKQKTRQVIYGLSLPTLESTLKVDPKISKFLNYKHGK